jgi:hypothetical protein
MVRLQDSAPLPHEDAAGLPAQSRAAFQAAPSSFLTGKVIRHPPENQISSHYTHGSQSTLMAPQVEFTPERDELLDGVGVINLATLRNLL